jgi:hypothetical protein
VLKGVISSEGELRAIFALDPSATTYITAGPGDAVAGLTIQKVGSAEVIAASSTGDLIVLRLLGAGEGASPAN